MKKAGELAVTVQGDARKAPLELSFSAFFHHFFAICSSFPSVVCDYLAQVGLFFQYFFEFWSIIFLSFFALFSFSFFC